MRVPVAVPAHGSDAITWAFRDKGTVLKGGAGGTAGDGLPATKPRVSVAAGYWKAYDGIVPAGRLVQIKEETYAVERYDSLTGYLSNH